MSELLLNDGFDAVDINTHGVTIHLKLQSQPIIHANTINLYEKGSFLCVFVNGEKIYKYPISDIFRVIEDYGFHGDAK